MYKFVCPKCGVVYGDPKSHAGSTTDCPACRKSTTARPDPVSIFAESILYHRFTSKGGLEEAKARESIARHRRQRSPEWGELTEAAGIALGALTEAGFCLTFGRVLSLNSDALETLTRAGLIQEEEGADDVGENDRH